MMTHYLTTHDIAERLGVTNHAVCRWLRQGRMRGDLVGVAPAGGWRIRPSDLDAFLAGGWKRRGGPYRPPVKTPRPAGPADAGPADAGPADALEALLPAHIRRLIAERRAQLIGAAQ